MNSPQALRGLLVIAAGSSLISAVILLPDTGRPAASGRPVSEKTIAPAAPERPAAPVETPPPRRFEASIAPIRPNILAKMGTSWKAGCPVPLEDLRVISMTHWTFDGRVQLGELIVHRRYANTVKGVFRTLFEARFPIEKMEPANGYMGNDPPLAQRNNTVGFHCRAPVGGGRRWSEHSYGTAIDINPDLNPYVSRSGRVEPLHGDPFVDRRPGLPGMIVAGDLVVRAFRDIGWRWGGNWSGTKDYMHFSATGR